MLSKLLVRHPGFGGDTNIITLNSSCNLWQIGANQKPGFGTPGEDFGIATDLDSAYPVNSSCSFWVKIPENPLQWASSILLFEHRYTTDSLHDGGTIEYSCNGTEWANVVGINTNSPIFRNFQNFPLVQDYGGYFEQGNIPTLDDFNYAFTGETNGWQWSGVHMVWAVLVKSNQISEVGCDFNNTDSVQFRFSFFSDSTFDSQPGWMIRNIVVGSADVGGGLLEVNNSSRFVYPNPCSNVLRIKDCPSHSNVSVFNTMGKRQLNLAYSENGVDISSLPKGLYCLQFDTNQGVEVSKFIKE